MGTFRAGCGEAVITPGLGVAMAGYFEERRSTGVHDDLRVKALLLEEGGCAYLWLVFDLICLPAEVAGAVCRAAAEAAGVPADRVAASATHTHTGPETRRERLAPDDPTAAWLDTLPSLAGTAAARARESLEPCTGEAASAAEDRISFNRRYRMRDGSVRTNPGQANPDILGPAHPADPRLDIVAFRRSDRTLKALLLNFACHPDTVGGTEFSADYPGYLARRLADRLPDRPFVFFLNGACGDINHIDVRSSIRRKGHEHARWMGETLAGDVCAALPGAKPLRLTPLGGATARVRLPVRDDGPADSPESTVTLVHAGELALVGLPGEVFSGLQADIRARSPFALTPVAELTGGWIGYVPTAAAFAENRNHVSAERMTQFDIMGYEVRSALSRGFIPGVGEALADAAARLLAAAGAESGEETAAGGGVSE